MSEVITASEIIERRKQVDTVIRDLLNNQAHEVERKVEQLEQELQAIKEQLEIAEEVLSVQVTKSAIRYFENKTKRRGEVK